MRNGGLRSPETEQRARRPHWALGPHEVAEPAAPPERRQQTSQHQSQAGEAQFGQRRLTRQGEYQQHIGVAPSSISFCL